MSRTPEPARPSYLDHERTIRSWLLTRDHKRIGVLYLVTLVALFFVGALFALLMRLELLTPGGDLLASDSYNKFFTAHGTIMVWFFLIPSIPAVLGNFVVPLMVGARDVAFPRLNLASWYIFVLGAAFTIYVMIAGGVDTGWTFYTPYSSTYSNSHVILTATGVFIVGFSSILTALNMIVTTHTMRAPGMTWGRLPLFVWAIYSTSAILILATPVLATALSLVAIERLLGFGIFDPALDGDPLLFQHLFWFYSHPAVYIMLLPGMGVVSELITCFSRKRIFGYWFIAASSIMIAALGFLVWGHHMFVSGQSITASVVFSFLSYMVAIPSAVKVFNWTATLYKGSISLDTPMLYALGFIWLFLLGGLTGLILAALPIDVQVHDTAFVVAHFHYIMVGGAVMAFLGGLHFWWPKISGRMYPELLGKVSAIAGFVGFNVTFMPLFVLGYLGMPRRYHSYPEEWQWMHVTSTAGLVLLGVGYGLPFLYLIWSLFRGPEAGPNPWRARGLEWERCDSPPSPHNFARTPIVDEGPYAYPTRDEEDGRA
jgi:cytochrome c oxidase subunit I